MTTQTHSPIERLAYWVKEIPNQPYLRQPHNNSWHQLSFKQTWDKAARIANYLSKYPPRSRIGIYSLNCADWIIADIAILMAGHISVPVYPTAGQSTIEYIVGHAELKLVFVGKLFDWNEKSTCFEGLDIISIFNKKENCEYVENIIKEFTPIDKVYDLKPEDILTITYTSGTTGNPKGVMISCRAISSAIDSVNEIYPVSPSDRFFSYLPLAHIAERMVVEMASIYCGVSVSFVDSIDKFATNLRSVKPTIFFAVPRIWLKLKQKVELISGGSYIANKLLNFPIIGSMLKKMLLKLLGLNKARLCISAAASLPKSTLDWFDALGIQICEAYGLTETCGFSHINLPGHRKVGTVGKPYPSAQCMLAENGEVLLSNPSLMDGYYKEPELSSMAIYDGWFRTGDLGKIDNEGFLSITGRVKELFKTSKGKYISPTPIENLLHPMIDAEHICIMGMNLPQPVAIVSVPQLWSPEFKQKFEGVAKKALKAVNLKLESHERIRSLIVVNEDWTTENNLLTPTLKVRRQQVEERYADAAVLSVNEKNTVIWSQ